MFVALEVLSLPLYILCGLARRRRLLSQEASLKYFLLGAFSSAFFIFGAALLYGFSGSVYLGEIAVAIGSPNSELQGLLVPGILLVAVGLLFKVSAAPFHMWTPDVYTGAPTPVTGFMAAATKAAAFGAMLRFLYVGVDQARWDWHPMLALVAADHHARRRGAVGHPDRRQAAAGLLLHRPRRVHPRRRAGHGPQRRRRGDVLPRGVRLDDHRRVRHRRAGPRHEGQVRGHRPVAVGRAGQAPPAHGGHVRVPAAGLRRHTRSPRGSPRSSRSSSRPCAWAAPDRCS